MPTYLEAYDQYFARHAVGVGKAIKRDAPIRFIERERFRSFLQRTTRTTPDCFWWIEVRVVTFHSNQTFRSSGQFWKVIPRVGAN